MMRRTGPLGTAWAISQPRETEPHLRIFLIEPYFGGSHAAWAEGYAQASAHDVDLLTLPARFWKWRMRGAALTMAEQVEELIGDRGKPDVVLVSDMLDLPAFLGLTRHYLGRPAVALYMHENQLTYPPPPGVEADHSYGFTNWLSAAAADLVLFNSSYHLEEFFSVLPGLLGSLPDFTHEEAIGAVRARSSRCTTVPSRSHAGSRAARLAPRACWTSDGFASCSPIRSQPLRSNTEACGPVFSRFDARAPFAAWW